jgi:crotonobetaine/carnitine-CoA ligase
MAVPDAVREEEVLACVVLRPDAGCAAPLDTAQTLFAHCDAELAYYKAPGWLYFTDSIPTTGTQKVQKHAIFAGGVDPREADGVLDLRGLKRRKA